jgi:hypothetical protein
MERMNEQTILGMQASGRFQRSAYSSAWKPGREIWIEKAQIGEAPIEDEGRKACFWATVHSTAEYERNFM